jgi:hypothetical protein
MRSIEEMQEVDEQKESKWFKKYKGFKVTIEVLENGFLVDQRYYKNYEDVLIDLKDLIKYE